MKLKKISLIIITILLLPFNASAQNIINELENLYNDGREIGVLISGLFGGGDKGGSRNGAFKISTRHPKLKIKVRSCDVTDGTCIIDLIVENVDEDEVTLHFYNRYDCAMIAYDDEANQYNYEDIRFSIGDIGNLSRIGSSIDLEPYIPVKARIQIDGVKDAATIFRSIKLPYSCSEWNIHEKPIKFSNVPISREGDE